MPSLASTSRLGPFQRKRNNNLGQQWLAMRDLEEELEINSRLGPWVKSEASSSLDISHFFPF